MLDLLIGAVVAVGVGRYIIKGIQPQGADGRGLLLLIIGCHHGEKILPSAATSTGWGPTNIIEYVEVPADEPQRRPWYDDHGTVRALRLI